jgi:hypothetical protein
MGNGGGAKMFATPPIFVRLEARLVFSESTGVMGLLTASMALGYHWEASWAVRECGMVC